jgi:glycyl-tRNA synthetase beta subunit
VASKIKTILVTQPKPEGDKSPYFDLAKKLKVVITMIVLKEMELDLQNLEQQVLQVLLEKNM